MCEERSERRSLRRASWPRELILLGTDLSLIRSAMIPLLQLTTRQNYASDCRVRKGETHGRGKEMRKSGL